MKIKVYDILGREVKTLVSSYKNKGKHEVKFNANEFASGVYIYRLQINDFIKSRKMLLIK